MDELLQAVIESERYWDDHWASAAPTAFVPVVMDDGEGGTIEVYPDGSYVTKVHCRLA